MIWLMIVMMAVVVFMSRYWFFEPKLSFKRLEKIQGLLEYCAPAVLTAIIAPIIFLKEGKTLNLNMDNPYIIAAATACILIYLTKNTLLTVIVSMGIFLLMNELI
ncbi:AzlD domain-containing protein [uncultured Shewanella sp.]|uniref:AzlD domain-containing protein n=1 Tax=uncultured Shewanella sp. TaxID=173975 RepID=UPI00260414C3|nr:AzlD domain-containing protein [uncultured Shewanella sp.]